MSEDPQIFNAYRNRLTLAAYYLMTALVLAFAAFFLFREDWAAAFSTILIFLLMFVPSILKERYRVYVPFAIELGIVAFIFFTLFLGEVGRFYDRIPLWDKFLHFQSGLLLGATGFVLVYVLNEHKRFRLGLSPGFVSIFAVTFSLAIGALWEMAEFAGDSFFGSTWQPSNADTMWDLIVNLLGALIISVIGYFWMHRHQRLPFTPWMLRIKNTFKLKKTAPPPVSDSIEA